MIFDSNVSVQRTARLVEELMAARCQSSSLDVTGALGAGGEQEDQGNARAGEKVFYQFLAVHTVVVAAKDTRPFVSWPLEVVE